MIPRFISNPNGIFRIETNSVTVNTANVVFSTNNISNVRFSGLILIKFDQVIPTGTTTTLPLLINNQPITTYDGTALTVADYKGTGIYLAYYDANSKVLQLI